MDIIAHHYEASNEQLQDDISTLSATIQAATYQLLKLIGELDRRRGWSENACTAVGFFRINRK